MDHAEDREKVLTTLTKNLVVEAGAGTGKTTLLITRLCEAVLVQNVPVEKLVALTFTEKAAAEIKTRLILKLHEVMAWLRQLDRERTAQDRLQDLLVNYFALKPADLLPRAEAALARLDRASIGTIHSFCADILKTFPLEAGLAPHAEIDSGQKAERLFEARWNDFLDKELGISALRGAQWKEVLPNLSLTDLKQFTRELCSGKISRYDYFSHDSLLAAFCEEKSQQAQAWSTAFLPAGKKPRNCEKALAWAAASLLRTAAFMRRQTPEPAGQEDLPAFPAKAVAGWEEDVFDEARGLVEIAQKLTPENQTLFLQALELVRPVAEQIRQDYEREGILSFDDLIVKTRDLLQHDLLVRRLLKEKFDLLFIDEFQDTDPVQGEIMLFLAEEKLSSAPRWQEVRLEPGKLFVVGDPKQSIYRFRGADITAYELFTELILKQGGEKCFLQQNFRSCPDIVAVANEVCRRAMVQESSFQPAYVPIFPAKAPRANTVEWLFIRGDQAAGGVDDYRHNQAEQVARWIDRNVGSLELADGHKLTYGDIAILTRAATTISPYTDALRRHAIPFNVEADKDFYRKQEVNDFLNFLRVLADPQDHISLTGVLRSPWGGFTDEEIYQIAKRGELTLSVTPADEALAVCYARIRELAEKAGRMGLTEFLPLVLEETFLPEACAAAYDSEQTLNNLQRLIHLACSYQTPVSLGQFLSSVQEILQQKPELLGANAADDAKNAVAVMTVHKSKGLGFPVVILIDLSKKGLSAAASGKTHVFSWKGNMHGLRVGKICDANLVFLEEEQKKHARCEEVRVLYVAMTRAQEKMILVADGRDGAEKAAQAFVAARLFPSGAQEQLQTDEVCVPVYNAAYEPVENFRHREQATPPVALSRETLLAWKNASLQRIERYKQLTQDLHLSPSAQVQVQSTFSAEQRAGAEVGTLCHRVLERLLSGPKMTVEQTLEQVSGELAHCAQTALPLLKTFTQSALWQEITTCRLLATEMPFTSAVGGKVQTGVMDVVLERPGGVIWVLDYKTDVVTTQGTRALLEKYRPQLTVYEQAARQLFPGKTLRVSAVFVRAIAAEDL